MASRRGTRLDDDCGLALPLGHDAPWQAEHVTNLGRGEALLFHGGAGRRLQIAASGVSVVAVWPQSSVGRGLTRTPTKVVPLDRAARQSHGVDFVAVNDDRLLDLLARLQQPMAQLAGQRRK